MCLEIHRGWAFIALVAIGFNLFGCAGPDIKQSASVNELPQIDPNAAINSLRLRADKGDVDAQVTIGEMYSEGSGIARSYKEAAKWYRLAAEQGDQLAQYELGYMYSEGLGVPQDKILAYMWSYVVISSASGAETKRDEIARQNAQSNLRLLEMYAGMLPDELTPAEIADTKEMARRCEEQHFKQCGRAASFQLTTNETTVSTSPGTRWQEATPSAAGRKTIKLENDGGTYVIPVLINGAITLKFTIDSGATDVSVPADVFLTLVRAGTIVDTDLIGKKTYILADGSKVPSQTFRIRSLKVGDTVVENVLGSVADAKGSLLLGQSFLERLIFWSIDNKRHFLVLN